MKWRLSKDNYVFYIIILILVSFIINIIFFNKINKSNETSSNIKELDSIIINYQIVDSIKYRIQYRDSIITKIKHIYEEEIIKTDNLNDDDAVMLFKSLCTE